MGQISKKKLRKIHSMVFVVIGSSIVNIVSIFQCMRTVFLKSCEKN